MTLSKAIEAAREAFIEIKGRTGRQVILYHADKALAALPEKPMTEDEVILLIKASTGTLFDHEARNIIHALRAANVLFVKED
jgi:hypothetical protein